MGSDDHEDGFERPVPRTDAEWDAFAAGTQYARVHDHSVPAESAYRDALGHARRDVLHRFVRGLLRGRPTGLPDPHVTSSTAPAVPDTPDPLAAVDRDRLLAVVRPLPAECGLLALQPLPASDAVLVIHVASRRGYDRFRLVGPVRRWRPDSPPETATTVEHPVDLVPALEREGAFVDAEQAARVRSELAESVANLALAQLAELGHTEKRDSTSGAVLELVAESVAAADAAAAFERLVTDGHPFHPGAKIRRGMTATEGLAYAPEFTDRIDLRFVAVRRDYAREAQAAAADRLTDRLYAVFEGLQGALERALPHGRAPDEYAVVPVHPWQFHHVIPDRYARQYTDERVVPIPDYTHPATPQLNLRTVVPYETEQTAEKPLPHLKLAIDVQTTNVVRTLSPHAVTNGPQVTDLVAAVDRAESLETLGFVPEPAATCYYAPGGPHPDGEAFDDARHLSGLLRQNPLTHLLVPEGAHPVVAASLLADAPSTGRPLVCELVDRYATTTDATTTGDAALDFLDAYAAVVVPEHLLLSTKYGIALESHLQNSLVVFEDARPVAVLVRDFGGIRVHDERLAAHDLSIDSYPDSDLDADGETDLHWKLYYALFQNHLGELVVTVSHELDVDEAACWDRVRTQCERAFETIASNGTVPDERVRRDRRALFGEQVPHKALTAMRLRGKRHEYVTSQVSNPLAPR